MTRKNTLLLLVLILLIPILLKAQSEDKSFDYAPLKGLQKTQGFLDHLINPEHFTMSQSYSLSFFDIGGSSVSQGLYLNTLNYRFSDPLMMQVRFGFLHHPFGAKGYDVQNTNQNKFFIQRAMLQYKPSQNMTFTVDFQQIPQAMISPYGYYNRYRSRYNHSE
jgi:hypothetical protein